MSRRRDLEPHPVESYHQVTVEEIDALLAMGPRKFLRDGSKIVSLLHRMRGTLVAAHETVRGLQRHIVEQSAHLARVGTPTTLNPLDAVKYLDDAQKELIFDRITRERLAMLRRLVARAESERETLAEQLALVRSVAESLSQQADLPPHVREDVTRHLATLPLEPAKVHHPPMIDFPDPEPLVPPASAATTPQDGVGGEAAEREPAFPAPAMVPSAPAPAEDEVPPVFVDPYAPDASAPAYRDPYSTSPPSGGQQ